MRILLDESVPRRLKRELRGHDVDTVTEMGWQGKSKGELLGLASTRYETLIIVDRNLEFQQNLRKYDIAIILLIAQNYKYETIHPLVPQILDTLETISRGDFVRLSR